jgi:hypothetical protein
MMRTALVDGAHILRVNPATSLAHNGVSVSVTDAVSIQHIWGHLMLLICAARFSVKPVAVIRTLPCFWSDQ